MRAKPEGSSNDAGGDPQSKDPSAAKVEPKVKKLQEVREF